MTIGSRAALLALAVAASGCGRAEWREADTRLNAAAEQARAAGFTPMSGPYNTFGNFSSRGEVPWRVHLEAHQSYYVAAACTAGCDTLDFAIAEPHGAEIARDTSAGATPRLVFQAPEEGDYRVTLTFGRCLAERCRWIAQVFERRPNS